MGAANGSPSASHPKPRLIGLDILRFLAAMLVLHLHAVQEFGALDKDTSTGWLSAIINSIANQGRNGVDIFFVLSGFLVAGLFFEELKRSGTVSPGRFLIRRGFKIYPQFWAMTAVTACCFLWQSQPVSASSLCSDLLFFQSYVPGFWPHTWTLSVEEHFYLLLAGVFCVLKRAVRPQQPVRVEAIPNICVGIILFSLAARILTWRWSWDTGFTVSNANFFLQATHVRIDSLFFGVLLAFFWHQRWTDAIKCKLFRNRLTLLVAGVFVLLTPYPIHALDLENWLIFGCMLLYLGAGCLLLAALSLDQTRCPKPFRFMAWLGRYSYAVYLWHMIVLWSIKPFTGSKSTTPLTFLGKELLFLIVIWVLGITLTKLIELPMLRLRDRFFPSRS